MAKKSSEVGCIVPAFLLKLWALVDDQETDDSITWDISGRSFHVFDEIQFAREILPRYFKHSNMSSFIRQLNMYGFKKIPHVASGGLFINIKSEVGTVEFAHRYFVRAQKHLLERIQRNVKSAGGRAKRQDRDCGSSALATADLAAEMDEMRSEQEGLKTRLESLSKENTVVWRELASLRQKSRSQQQIINKLIQFMVSVMTTSHLSGTMKRKMPLMLNSSDHGDDSVPPRKRRSSSQSMSKLPTYYSEIRPSDWPRNSTPSPPPTTSTATPDTAAGANNELTVDLNQLDTMNTDQCVILGDILDSGYHEEVLETGSPSASLPVVTLSDSQSSHSLESPSHELDVMKDLLMNGQLNCDLQTILGLFSPDTGISPSLDMLNGLATPEELTMGSSSSIVGNELIQYVPFDDNQFLQLEPEEPEPAPSDIFDNIDSL